MKKEESKKMAEESITTQDVEITGILKSCNNLYGKINEYVLDISEYSLEVCQVFARDLTSVLRTLRELQSTLEMCHGKLKDTAVKEKEVTDDTSVTEETMDGSLI